MNQSLLVTKRDGRKERINLDKIHRVIDWAAEGLHNVSVSQVELRSHIQFYDGIKTADIHETIIKAAADLISRDAPDYQYGRSHGDLPPAQKAYGQFEPPKLHAHVTRMVEMGKYDKHLLEDYSAEEFEQMDSFIDHWRDMNFSYAAVKQLEGKYLVQNRVSARIYESAQFLYMLVSACLFSNYPRETRLDYVKRFYDAISTFKISLPTPIMSGVRTNPPVQLLRADRVRRQHGLHQRHLQRHCEIRLAARGIGINAGRIRALGSRSVAVKPSIPAVFRSTNTSRPPSNPARRAACAVARQRCSTRCGTEVESLLVLKNNRGVEGNRVRHMDYGVQLNRLMYQRLIKGEDITLFSRPTCRGCMTRSSPIRTNSNACIPSTRKTTAFARSA